MTPDALRKLIDTQQQVLSTTADLSALQAFTPLSEEDARDVEAAHSAMSQANASLNQLLERYKRL